MRVTSTDFIKQCERLEEVLGVKIETNIWHRHFSAYTSGPNGSCQYELVSSNTARDAVDQIRAILNTQYAMSELKKRGAK